MASEETFLKYLIDEEIYVIEDKKMPDTSLETVNADDKVAVDSDEKVDSPKKVDSPEDINKEKSTNEYRNSTVLLIDYDNRSLLPRDYEAFLSKILNSVNLNLNSVDMVFKVEFGKLSTESFIDCHVVSFLPVLPQHLNTLFTEEKYFINIIRGSQFLACDTLNILSDDKTLKRKLWDQLKLLYGI